MTALVLTLALVGLAALGVPLFLVLGTVTTLCFALLLPDYGSFDSFQVFAVKITNLASKNVLLAIPFFVASGAIMSAGSMSRRLVTLARALVGWLPGGLAVSAVFACVLFSAISGSSPVTVIAIGSLLLPALLKEGYPERFSLGLLASAGSLGIVIPPSIPLLVYALVASNVAPVDVAEIFLAGVGPGLLLAGLLAVHAVVTGVRRRAPTTPFELRALGTALREGSWALGLPALILGGIYGGLFTPTEAAAVSVVYALIVELGIHRQLDRRALARALADSAVALGALVVIMAFSITLNDFFVQKRLPELAAAWLTDNAFSPFGFVLALNLLLLLVGCLMDSVSALLILTPLLVPLGRALGLDLVHLGVIFIVNLEIGYLTPPIGMNLFVASSVFERPLGEVVRGALPFLGVLAFGLLLVSYVPTLSLGPVNLLLRGGSAYVPFPERAAPRDEALPPGDSPPGASEGGDHDGAPPPAADGAVRSMRDLMEELRRKRAQEDATPPPAPP